MTDKTELKLADSDFRSEATDIIKRGAAAIRRVDLSYYGDHTAHETIGGSEMLAKAFYDSSPLPQMQGLVGALKDFTEGDRVIELNENNYNHDDVCELNQSNLEFFDIAKQALAKLEGGE